MRGEMGARLPSPIVSVLREAKHRAAVFGKHASWGFPQIRGPLTDPLWGALQTAVPYPFPEAKYAHTWLGHSVESREVVEREPIPRRIFVIWSGSNELTPRRAASLQTIREVNQDIDVVLVTPENLADWLVPEHPLPAEYEHLSLVHKSDYLRCYLLHHHGGGYSDIKPHQQPWRDSFRALEASAHWLLGYTEVHHLLCPLVGGTLQSDLHRVSRQLLGYGGLIARSQTPISEEWLDRVEALLVLKADELAAAPGNVRGDNPGYPLGWTEPLAHILAPLTWKYQAHVIHDNRVRPVLRNYT